MAVVMMFPGIITAINGQGETLTKISSVVAVLAMLLFLLVISAVMAPSFIARQKSPIQP